MSNNIYAFFLNKLHYGYTERFVDCNYEAMLVNTEAKLRMHLAK